MVLFVCSSFQRGEKFDEAPHELGARRTKLDPRQIADSLPSVGLSSS